VKLENGMAKIYNARELKVYKLAYDTALEIYHLTKNFPSEEKYDLVSQIRRSSRSVPANLIEAWRRRRYPKNFVSKLNDCETEADETIYWLEVAKDCGYIDEKLQKELSGKYDHIIAMIIKMINNKDDWTL
jgi:four helix bundle protein